jgi:CelD/BcsL family acetyltransferase involved in cellulose biosynthesis
MNDSIVVDPPGPSAMPARDRDATAAPGDRHVAMPIRAALATEWRPLSALHAILPEWRVLAGRTIEPNVFYEPAFALPAATAFAPDAGAILVWSKAGRETLVGLFPVRVERRRYGLAFPILTGWTHPYAPLGVPLVDRDVVEPVVASFLDHVAADPELPKVMLFRFIPQDGAFASALDRTLARRGGRAAVLGRHQRALLAPLDDRGRYLDRSVGSKRRKEFRRQRHRLEDAGAVSLTTAVAAADIGPALCDFLDLEAKGWKGRRGTAAAGQTKIRRFIETAIPALAADGMAQVHRLLVAERPIAAAITLTSADRAWFFKIAYDETLARASPGVQLTLDLTAVLLNDTLLSRADSCATENHPMIDHLWRERLTMVDRLVAGSEAAVTFALACRLESLRRAAIRVARRLRDGLS